MYRRYTNRHYLYFYLMNLGCKRSRSKLEVLKVGGRSLRRSCKCLWCSGVCGSFRLEAVVPRSTHVASFLGSVLLRIRCLRHLSPRRIHLDQKPTLTYSQSKCNMLRTQIIFSINNEVECMFVFFCEFVCYQ